jgi:hypothetical protein
MLEKVAEVLAAEDIGVGGWAVGFPWEVAKHMVGRWFVFDL